MLFPFLPTVDILKLATQSTVSPSSDLVMCTSLKTIALVLCLVGWPTTVSESFSILIQTQSSRDKVLPEQPFEAELLTFQAKSDGFNPSDNGGPSRTRGSGTRFFNPSC